MSRPGRTTRKADPLPPGYFHLDAPERCGECGALVRIAPCMNCAAALARERARRTQRLIERIYGRAS